MKTGTFIRNKSLHSYSKFKNNHSHSLQLPFRITRIKSFRIFKQPDFPERKRIVHGNVLTVEFFVREFLEHAQIDCVCDSKSLSLNWRVSTESRKTERKVLRLECFFGFQRKILYLLWVNEAKLRCVNIGAGLEWIIMRTNESRVQFALLVQGKMFNIIWFCCVA